MKTLLFLLISCCCIVHGFSQDISGKWYGKITQHPGGYSQLYDFELNLKQGKSITGESLSLMKDSLEIRIGLSGYADRDTFRLSESRDWIRVDKVPWNWVACIKNINVAYRKEQENEYLEGNWNGVSKDKPYDDCIPGRVILSRTVSGLNQFLYENRDSVITASNNIPEPNESITDFKTPFLDTEIEKVTEIQVHNKNLQLQMIDYLKVDNDTVSVYLNRKVLAKNIWISKRAAVINFTLDPNKQLHEILLYAENLGEIPPNTSELFIIDGEDTHRVMIVSDKQKTAAVYLKYKPRKNQ